jgi:hypothetical protein
VDARSGRQLKKVDAVMDERGRTCTVNEHEHDRGRGDIVLLDEPAGNILERDLIDWTG